VVATQLQATAWRGKAEVLFVSNPSLSPPAPDGAEAAQYRGLQARLARSPKLAARVVRTAEVPGLTAAQFLQHSSATPVSDADVLTLSVIYRSSAAAVRLTNAYATEFVRFKDDLNLRTIREILRANEARIDEVRSRGRISSVSTSTSLVRPADGASSFRPHALRNGLFGGALGALLGVVLVLGLAALRRS
jgi:capsular polysaccharide biosynthesis protein